MASGHSRVVPHCPGRRWKLLIAPSMSRNQSHLDGKKKRPPPRAWVHSAPWTKANAQVMVILVQQVLEEGGWVHLF